MTRLAEVDVLGWRTCWVWLGMAGVRGSTTFGGFDNSTIVRCRTMVDDWLTPGVENGSAGGGGGVGMTMVGDCGRTVGVWRYWYVC